MEDFSRKRARQGFGRRRARATKGLAAAVIVIAQGGGSEYQRPRFMLCMGKVTNDSFYEELVLDEIKLYRDS